MLLTVMYTCAFTNHWKYFFTYMYVTRCHVYVCVASRLEIFFALAIICTCVTYKFYDGFIDNEMLLVGNLPFPQHMISYIVHVHRFFLKRYSLSCIHVCSLTIGNIFSSICLFVAFDNIGWCVLFPCLRMKIYLYWLNIYLSYRHVLWQPYSYQLGSLFLYM